MRRRSALWVRRVTGGLLIVSALGLAAVGVHRYKVLKPQLLRLLPEGLGGDQGQSHDVPVGVYKGFEHIESLAGKPVFTIQAVQTMGMESGWYRLEGVNLKLYREDGGSAEIVCDSARFNAKTRAAELEGSVHLEFGDGGFVDTRWGRFDPRDRVFSSSGEVFFGRRGMVGRAGRLFYQLTPDRLVLTDGVRVFGPGGSVLLAPKLVYDRQHARAVFSEGCRLTDQLSEVKSPRVVVELEGREGDPKRVLFEEGARFLSREVEGAGEIRGSAERLRLDREGVDVWRGVASTSGPWVSLELTNGPDFLLRHLRTWRLEFVTGSAGPVSAHSSGATCLFEVPVEDGPPRHAVSEEGTYRFEKGRLTDMELTGSVAMTSGAAKAWAPSARLLTSRRIVSLQSSPAGGKERVHAVMQGSEMWAEEIQLLDGGDRLTARGDVQGQTTGIGFAGGEEKGKEEETRFAAENLEARPKKSLVVLTRNARAWQGSRLLLAEEIQVNEAAKTLEASGDVRMTLPSEETGTDRHGEMLVVARTLNYAEHDRKAVFEGAVRLSDPAHILSSAKLTVMIDAEGAVSGFQAEEQVVVEETSVHRRMTGDEARYDRASQVMVVTGSPAHLLDEKGNVVSGRSLTWHRADDTVTVAGEEESPTETIFHPED